MRCNLCGSMDANIRPIELATARITLRAHVDCSRHGQYRSVSREEIKEATNRVARLLNAIPEMRELLTDLSQAYDDSQSGHELASRLYDLRCRALRLLNKIEGGGE